MVTNGSGLSNEERCELLVEGQGIAIFAIQFAVKAV